MTPDDPEFEAYIRGAFFESFEDVALGAPQTRLHSSGSSAMRCGEHPTEWTSSTRIAP